jgi:hypothetical protein
MIMTGVKRVNKLKKLKMAKRKSAIEETRCL